MHAKCLNHIVIVGGGSSGWLTAAGISSKIPGVRVTVVDKEEPEIVGVGEATILGFVHYMNECGFPQHEWMMATDVVLKGGILFPDWGKDGNNIWHPFYFFGGDYPMIDAWSNNQDIPFHRALPLSESTLRGTINTQKLESYAILLDCGKLVNYIQTKIADKVNYINSSVEQLKDDTLYLKNGNKIEADLFIDCSGFKRLLKQTDTVELTDRLFCDTAVAGHIPYKNESENHPYVVCPAVDHGWIWKIPLQSRIGSGLVFNRQLTDPEEAKQYFVDYWDGRVDKDSLKLIDWTPFYDKKPWDKNVISIGLSSGFIEPLESTGLGITIEQIDHITKCLMSRYYSKNDIDLYNNIVHTLFETCIDFVNMHYSKSTKDTKFWRYVRDNYKMSDLQKIYLDNLQNSMEPSFMEYKGFIFGGTNWLHWLVQLGFPIKPKTYRKFDRNSIPNFTDDGYVTSPEFTRSYFR